MRAVDVGVESAESILEGIRDEALRGQVVALVRMDLLNGLEQAGVAFQRSAVKFDVLQKVADPVQMVLGVLQRHPAYDPMHPVALFQQQFGQVTAVLAGDSGY